MNKEKSLFNQEAVDEIKKVYADFKGEIKNRLKEFRDLVRYGSKEEIFTELTFCLLTPQSKATTCWRAVENMIKNGTLFKGNAKEIQENLKGVRFKYKKAEYIVTAREQYFNGKNPIFYYIKNNKDPFKLREYLIENVKGLGCKEASHFLRNIGLGHDLAILDRHILKNLRKLRVIENPSKSYTEKKYLRIEKKMREFSKLVEIPMDHLDLTLWAKEAVEVFK